MNDWNQAYRLAAFEIKASLRNLLLILAFYIAMSLIFMMSFDVYLEGDFKGFDIMFLLVFFMFPAWMKGKEFQMQKMDGNLWSSPPIIMLQQLPISRNTIVKSRFLIHAFCSFPFQLILLIAMPLMSDNFREAMTPVSYAVFVLMWLAISIAVGFMMAASEAGGNFKMKEMVLSFVYIVIAAAAIYWLFPMLSGGGFIEWTMAIAVDWPLLTGVAAVLLMIAGWKYWQVDMRKTMKKTDYL
ncbi:hypothetical protein PO902_05965 [Planococcus maritimus]|nr:hypothetical protein [Planococcus sp. SK3692]MDE4084593.1 hypothetical protein [Planococcus maritimus]